MADYLTNVTIEVNGHDVELEVEVHVDEDWMYDYVTLDGCSDWAQEHFINTCDVPEFITNYLQDLPESDMLAFLAPFVGVEVK